MPNDFNADLAPVTEHIEGQPKADLEFRRSLMTRLAHEGNQPFQNPYAAENAPTHAELDAIKKARLAGKSKYTREAMRIEETANPLGPTVSAQDAQMAAAMKKLASSSVDPATKAYQDRMASNPLDRMHHYRNSHEDAVVRALERDHARNLAKQKAATLSAATYNHPGVIFHGAKQRAARELEEGGRRDLVDTLAKLRHQGWQSAIGASQNQQYTDALSMRTIGALKGQDAELQMRALNSLKDLEDGRVQKIYKHAGIKQLRGTTNEARRQAALDARYDNWLESRDWSRLLTKHASDVYRGLPGPISTQHQIRTSTPSVYTGMNQMLGNILGGLGEEYLPKRKKKGGRIKKAVGGPIMNQAVFNAVAEGGNGSGIDHLKQLERQELQQMLLKRQMNHRNALKAGGLTTPIDWSQISSRKFLGATKKRQSPKKISEPKINPAASPIEIGASLAKRTALQDRQLAEAERLRQPQEEHHASRIGRVVADAMANSGNPGLMGMGATMQGVGARRDMEEAAIAAKRKESFELEKQVAKELAEEERIKHQQLMDERRVKADERRAAIDARRLDYDNARIELDRMKLHGDGTLQIGQKTVNPRVKLGLSPQDQVTLREQEKLLQKLEERRLPYENAKKTLESRQLQKDLPMTGILSEITPDLTEKAREHTRNLNKMVASEMLPGPGTKAKIEFAERQKPTHRSSPKEVIEFAQKGEDAIQSTVEPLELARSYSTYGIPPRTTIAAFEAWDQNGREGSFEDFLINVIEAKQSLTLTNKREKKSDSRLSESSKLASYEAELAELTGNK